MISRSVPDPADSHTPEQRNESLVKRNEMIDQEDEKKPDIPEKRTPQRVKRVTATTLLS